MRRGVGDLRSVPEESKGPAKRAAAGGRGGYVSRDRNAGSELVVEDSEVLAPETRFVVRDGSTSIGRSPESDIVLKSDDYASGRHARLTRHGGLLYVEDTESTNGTYVNDRKTVGATPLREGDTIKVGSTTFRYTG
ncbi:MAG: FHA domain-containing protein [Rubrobacter sp.]|nr:FHA domain-containing protein [Rubrobacter sp.]